MKTLIVGLIKRVGFRWYEWVFVGLMLAVIAVTYMLYQRLDTAQADLVKAEQVLQLNEKKEERMDESMELDRAIGYEFFNEQMELVREQYIDRGTVIDQYLAHKSQVSVEPPIGTRSKDTKRSEEDDTDDDPDTDVATQVAPEPPRPKPATPTPKLKTPTTPPAEVANHESTEPTPDDLAGLQLLVNSMQQSYCRAKSNEDNCPTTDSSG